MFTVEIDPHAELSEDAWSTNMSSICCYDLCDGDSSSNEPMSEMQRSYCEDCDDLRSRLVVKHC